jgi:hypothetical protein
MRLPTALAAHAQRTAEGVPLRAALLTNLTEADVRTVGAFINTNSRPNRKGKPVRYENGGGRGQARGGGS